MLNYYQLLATGNWKLATALSPSIRFTLYEIRSTKDYVRNYKQNMQNKANFRKVKLNVSPVNTKDYGQMDTWWSGKNKANSKPIKANYNQKNAKTNPNKANFKRGIYS